MVTIRHVEPVVCISCNHARINHWKEHHADTIIHTDGLCKIGLKLNHIITVWTWVKVLKVDAVYNDNFQGIIVSDIIVGDMFKKGSIVFFDRDEIIEYIDG